MSACSASSFWRSFHGELAQAERIACCAPSASWHCRRHLGRVGPRPRHRTTGPSKPITVIVPFGAGGNTDALARIIRRGYPPASASKFVIENRVGAGSITGLTNLAKAAPDGYTIGVGTAAGLAINPRS